VEEFGLTKCFFTTTEVKWWWLAVVADALIAAKRAGKPLMVRACHSHALKGAWLWQAAPTGSLLVQLSASCGAAAAVCNTCQCLAL
jgi:hypothetical protein